MDDLKISRINELARKSKAEGLTPEEAQEQAALRKEYLASIRQNMISVLEGVYVVDENGKEKKVERKPRLKN